jgi:hypothetical protein
MLGFEVESAMAGLKLLVDWQRIAEAIMGFRGSVRAAAYEGLGPTFLDETAFLVENPAIPGDFTAPAIAAGLQGLDPRNGVERISKDDRVMEFPFENSQERKGIDPRCLAHQAGGDRQTEKPMSDRPTERAAFGRGVIHVNRVEISGDPREHDDIRLSHRPARTLPLIADDEVVK